MRPRTRSTFFAVLLLAALALAFTPAPAPPSTSPAGVGEFTPKLVTVDAPTRAERNRVADLGLDVTEHAGHDYVEVVLHTAADETRLRDAGFTWDVRIPDLIAREMERLRADAAYAESTAVSPLPSGRTTYRMPEDYTAEIDQLVADYAEAGPDGTPLAKRISIGESLEGRDLAGIEIGANVEQPEDGRPVFLMFGAHHAREWPSAELPMEFAYDLLQGYTDEDHDLHDRIVDVLTRGRAVIVPVSNPDGFRASRLSGEYVDLREADGGGTASILATPGNAYKRKNCRYVDGQSQPAGTCVAVPSPGGLGVGIDLNRNYGALWGGPGASDSQTSATYHGPAPFSEPETQAIRDLISSRQVTTVITNHTFGDMILRPVGVNPDRIHPDGNTVGYSPDECFATAGGDRGTQWLGERMAAQNGYDNQFGWELYDTTGTTEDYSYNATGGYGYTFEIGPNEFHPPFEQVVDEYTGETDAAEGVTADNAAETTTAAAADCGEHDHDRVGGGNREAFLIAFENAVDTTTHAVISGTAPAGATLTLQRTGVFPLWDGTQVEDTVATSMRVGEGGSFDWQVNPSTRPFVESRMATVLSDPKDSLEASGVLPPTRPPAEHSFEVTDPADLLRATVRTTYPVDGQAVTYAQFSLTLINPDGVAVATADEFGPINVITWNGTDGEGIEPGTWTLRVSNSLAVTSNYDLEAATQDILGHDTPEQDEFWTLTCDTGDGPAGEREVFVERGQAVDVGEACA